MALYTEDIDLLPGEGWVAIVLTGTVIHVTVTEGKKAVYRFGISSTSEGVDLDFDETISVDETFYIKASSVNSSGFVRITVNKD